MEGEKYLDGERGDEGWEVGVMGESELKLKLRNAEIARTLGTEEPAKARTVKWERMVGERKSTLACRVLGGGGH